MVAAENRYNQLEEEKIFFLGLIGIRMAVQKKTPLRTASLGNIDVRSHYKGKT
jgi:hypothetical protein